MLIPSLLLMGCLLVVQTESVERDSVHPIESIALLPLDYSPKDPYWEYYQDCDQWDLKFVSYPANLRQPSRAATSDSVATSVPSADAADDPVADSVDASDTASASASNSGLDYWAAAVVEISGSLMQRTFFTVAGSGRKLRQTESGTGGVQKTRWSAADDAGSPVWHQHQCRLAGELYRFLRRSAIQSQRQIQIACQQWEVGYREQWQPILWQAEQIALQRESMERFYLVPLRAERSLLGELEANVFGLSEKANRFLTSLSSNTTLFHSSEGGSQVAN